MKSLPILLTASFLLAALPLAGAETTECRIHPPREETFTHPLTAGRYLKIDVSAPEKLGEWVEMNDRAGLQTEDCGTTFKFYSKDARSLVLA